MATTGPFTRTGGIQFQGSTAYRDWYQRIWYRQSAPYKDPLPYSYVRRQLFMKRQAIFGTFEFYSTPADSSSISETDPRSSPLYDEAYAKAYSDFRSSISSNANLALDLAERKQASDMMVKRLSQLAQFTRALLRHEFGSAARTLGFRVTNQKTSRGTTTLKLSRSKKLRQSWRVSQARHKSRAHHRKSVKTDYEVRLKTGAKSFADNYLEFHFGWEPLIKDVGEAIEIFQSPLTHLEGNPIKGRASLQTQNVLDTGSPRDGKVYRPWKWTTKVEIRARAQVSNSNLHLADQLGFINPLVIAWEAVPFSFIVDWFTNVGQCLEAMTDFAGVTLTGSSYSFVNVAEEHRVQYISWNKMFHWEIKYHVGFVRTVGSIPGPKLTFKQIKLPSLTRGLTAASLLAQLLRNNRPSGSFLL